MTRGRAKGRAAASSPGGDRHRGTRRGPRIGAAQVGLIAVTVVLGACAARVPAPVESRGEEPVVTEPLAVAIPAPAAEGVSTAPLAVEHAAPAAALAPHSIVAPMEDTGEALEPPPPRVAALHPAIKELLSSAHRHSVQGRNDEAVAALERALQIEPSDAGLWHRLARARFEQGEAGLAEALAAKSNSLAAGDPELQAQNWRLIARIRQRLGDASGASEARARAAQVLN